MRSAPSPPPEGSPAPDSEAGSEVVSHVLVQVLVVAVAVALMQLGWATTTRNATISAAAEGARRAALQGAAEGDGAARALAVLEGAAFAPRNATAFETRYGPAVSVHISGDLPVLGSWGPLGSLAVTGTAPMEPGQP